MSLGKELKMKKILSIITAAVMVMSLMTFMSHAEEKEAINFSDVGKSRWSYDYIAYAVEKGYMNGVGDGKFDPTGTTTRGMVVTVLWRLQGSQEMKYQKKFTDVKEGKWYTSAVLWAAIKGIVNGVSAKEFAPDAPITREQLAAIIMRYSSFCDIDTSSEKDITGYSDYKKVSSYARDAMSFCNDNNIINGVSDTELQPRGNATREQFATILYKFDMAEYYGENPTFKYQLKYNEPVVQSKYTEPEKKLITDADIYVSADGNDKNPGTLEKPVKTFGKAKELVREKKETADKEIAVAFKAGNYGSLNIGFTKEDSGSETVPVKYCAYGDGDVVFDNGVSVKKDEFKKITDVKGVNTSYFPAKSLDHIYVADLSGKVGEIEDRFGIGVYGKDHDLICARYPNVTIDDFSDYLYDFARTTVIEKSDENGGKYITKMKVLTETPMTRRFAVYHNIQETVISGRIANEYTSETLPVLSYDVSSMTFTLDGQAKYWDRSESYSTPFFIWNVSEELDSKGEYYYDRENKLLFVYEPDEDYTLAEKGTFITNDGADYLTFEGLTFRCGTKAAMTMTASSITVKNCVMFGFGNDTYNETGIIGDKPTAYTVTLLGQNNHFIGNELSYLGAGGVMASATDETIIDTLENDGILVDNNYFHHFQRIKHTWVPAIRLSFNVGSVVSHNVCEHAPQSAIIYGRDQNTPFAKGRAVNCIIEYNVFDMINCDACDNGMIYTGRSVANLNNHIRYNLFMHTIPNNGNFMIYNDDGNFGQYVYGNVFYDFGSTAYMYTGGRESSVFDNVFINPDNDGQTGLAAWDKYYSMQLGSSVGDVAKDSGNFRDLQTTVSWLPVEGDPGYVMWTKTFPAIFGMNLDYKQTDDPKCILCPENVAVRNNIHVGAVFDIGEGFSKFGTVSGNVRYDISDNPFFACPARGDYAVTSKGEGIPEIDFAKIGRY